MGALIPSPKVVKTRVVCKAFEGLDDLRYRELTTFATGMS